MKNVRVTSGVNGMKTVALSLLCLAVVLPVQAGMQWKWKDANGVMQYTDRPPPPGTPDSQILARPTPSNRAPRVFDTASAASAPAAPVTSTAQGKALDPELEARRRKTEDDKAAKQKVEEEKQAKVRADNCERARSYERSLKDGMRIARTNAKGEREVLDDKARADEAQRTQETIQSNCR